jgi:hypothetical protein
MQEKFTQEAQERFRQLDPRLVQGALAVLGLLYLFFCYCSMLICKKTGQEPGVLVWIPIIQTFPLLKAAGMSAWWFLLVPVATICWCVKICRARGKSSWLGLFLLLPVTNVFTYLYLAFADGGNEKEATPERITFD